MGVGVVPMTGSVAVEPSERPVLDWVRSLLWPTADVEVAGRGPVGPDDRAWWILPDPAAPRVLVPVAGPAAAAALRQFNNSMSQPARLRKVAAGQVMRVAGRVLRLQRLTVRGASAEGLIGSYLPDLFRSRHVEVAISVGRALRPNLKPVLQVMTRDGRVLGYVKVGWNDVTNNLLDNEARALWAWASSPPRSFCVPRALHYGSWRGLQLLAVSPVPHPMVRRGRRHALPGAAVLTEVASLHGTRTAPISDSAYVRRLADRFEALAAGSGAAGGPADRALRTLRADDTTMALGTWHGDWAPWNMATTSRALFVWDWERSAEDAPVGLDALHFGFEVAYHKEDRTPRAALAEGLGRSRRALASMGIRTDLDRLERVYLLERLARIEEGRSAAVATDDRLRDWLLEHLGETT